MEQKIVFFDIDETLRDREHGIPKSAIKGIKALQKNGHLAFISTGRTWSSIPKEVLQIGFDGMITGCGTYIIYKDKVIFNAVISAGILEIARKAFEECRGFPTIEGIDHLYYLSTMEPTSSITFEVLFRDGLTDLRKSYEPGLKTINKITCFIDSNTDVSELKKRLKPYFQCLIHSSEFMEFIPYGFSKATGIQKVLEFTKIPRKNSYAFGDSINDKEMLEFVQYGIAMGNAIQEIKQIASHVTAPVWEDGIYQGLSTFNLI